MKTSCISSVLAGVITTNCFVYSSDYIKPAFLLQNFYIPCNYYYYYYIILFLAVTVCVKSMEYKPKVFYR